MQLLALLFSASGRIPPKPFAIGIIAVYLVAFLSQLLVSPPLLLRAGWLPFALVQATACWAWYCLHAKRLRDAGRGLGPAVAIATLYALAMVLLLLVVLLLLAGGAPGDVTQPPSTGLADFFVPAFLLAMVIGHSGLGLFGYVAMVMFAMIVIPIAMALGCSIWAGRRPTVMRAPALPS
jgi:uncharacterized membrane protein YhaH (DUF805 family)